MTSEYLSTDKGKERVVKEKKAWVEKNEIVLKWATPMLQQYWKTKSENFDKIIMYKVGELLDLDVLRT